MLACVGDDMFAPLAFDLFHKEAIDLRYIHQIVGVHTGVGLVTLLPSGENVIVVDPGANLQMTTTHVDALEPAIQAADLVMTQA